MAYAFQEHKSQCCALVYPQAEPHAPARMGQSREMHFAFEPRS